MLTTCQFEYRVARFPGLSVGPFLEPNPSASGGSEAQALLCAHALSTSGISPVVTDADMGLPGGWSYVKEPGNDKLKADRTVYLHSLAVSPRFQRCGLGKLLMWSFLQAVGDIGDAE